MKQPVTSIAIAILTLSAALAAYAVHAASRVTASTNKTEPVFRTTISAVSEPREITYDDLLSIVDLGVNRNHDQSGLALSPDGYTVAVETRQANRENNSSTLHWVIVPVDPMMKVVNAGDGGQLVSMSTSGTPTGYSPPQRPSWSLDSSWIAYKLRRNGESQIWRSRREDGYQEQLTRNAADVQKFYWSRDGKRLLFTVGISRSEFETQRSARAAGGFLFDERFAPLESLEPIEPDLQEKDVWVYDFKSRTERLAAPGECDEYRMLASTLTLKRRPNASWIRYAPGRELVAWLDFHGDSQRKGVDPPLTVMVSRSADGAKPVICSVASCTGHFKGLWISEDARSIYFLRWTNDDTYGSLSLYRWVVGSRATEEILRTDDLLEGCAQLGSHLICSHESSTTPRKLVRVDLATGKLTTIYDPNPQFKNIKFGRVTSFTWRDAVNHEGFGHIVLPVNFQEGVRYPLIVVQYRSRGFLRGGVGDEYPIHIFASKGFVVLSFHRPEDRDLERTSASFDEVSAKGWAGFRDRRLVQSVLEAGIDRLIDIGLVDPARVGISGLSDGGETVGFELIHSPQRFAAASVSWTFWNPIVYYLAGPHFKPRLSEWGLKSPDSQQGVANWREISIGLNAQKVRTPLLLQVSDSELLPETQTFAALTEFGKPVEMHVFRNEYHIKSQPAHRYSIYRRNVQWFQFWLQGVEDTDPVDSNQYARWHILKQRANAAE